MTRAAPLVPGAVIVAAGSGTRFGDADKVFVTLGGRPVLEYALRLMASLRELSAIALVLAEHNLARGAELVASLGMRDVVVCVGGDTRAASVQAGLLALDPDVQLVAVHDAARPLASAALLRRLLDAAQEYGAVVPCLPVSDTIHEVGPEGRLTGLLDRSRLRAVQTPQVFRRDWLAAASARVALTTTDEAGLLVAAGFAVHAVPGEPHNLKLTLPDDLIVAEALLGAGRITL